MKLIKYFFQFLIILILFLIFKILGFKLASSFSSKFFSFIGPFFRSKKLIENNVLKAIPDIDKYKIKKIIDNMWKNYGKILSDYVFMKNFRNSSLKNELIIEGQEVLELIKKDLKKRVKSLNTKKRAQVIDQDDIVYTEEKEETVSAPIP